MTEETLSVRRTVVCPEDVQIQDNMANAIETRDVETESIIQTDNVHIHTEIYSNTHLGVSSETNDESRGVPCSDFEYHEEHYMILHSSRSKSIETDSPDIDEDKLATKIQAVDAPSHGPQKDSWDEGSRLLSETGKISKMRKRLCHPDCPNLRISRSTQLQQVGEAGTSFEVSDTLIVTRTDKGSTTSIGEEDTAENLATIPEEETVYSTAVSAETQSVEDDQDLTNVAEEELVQENVEDAFFTDEEDACATQCVTESTETPDTDLLTIEVVQCSKVKTTVPAPDTDLLTIEEDECSEVGITVTTSNSGPLTTEEDEYSDKETTVPAPDTDQLTIEGVQYFEQGTAVPTESILEINIPKSRTEKQKKLERSKWESGSWIISPPTTRFDQAETRNCVKLIRLSSSQLHRGECRETRCASNIRCAASSNLRYDEDCRVDCSSMASSTYCRPREPFTCDRLRAINNAKMCSVAGFSACNQYNSNFNVACSNTSQYTARNCYTPAYCYSFNTWY